MNEFMFILGCFNGTLTVLNAYFYLQNHRHYRPWFKFFVLSTIFLCAGSFFIDTGIADTLTQFARGG